MGFFSKRNSIWNSLVESKEGCLYFWMGPRENMMVTNRHWIEFTRVKTSIDPNPLLLYNIYKVLFISNIELQSLLNPFSIIPSIVKHWWIFRLMLSKRLQNLTEWIKTWLKMKHNFISSASYLHLSMNIPI